MIPSTGLYEGTLRHRRFAVRPHTFTYDVFMALLDIDCLRETMKASRLTSYNRWNWASYDERDHFGDPTRTLRERIVESAHTAGVALPGGKIFLLTNLRYAGYVFNPISIYYCYDTTGRLRRVLAEVNNTYGGRQLYWLSDTSGAGANSFRAYSDKTLYVSPFLDVEMTYEFVLTPPGDSLVAHMNVRHGSIQTGSTASDATLGPIGSPPGSRDSVALDATLTLRHRPWTASAVRSALVRLPLMTTKVIAAIHWQALRLYLKGVPVVPRLVPDGVDERLANSRRAATMLAAASAAGAVEESR